MALGTLAQGWRQTRRADTCQLIGKVYNILAGPSQCHLKSQQVHRNCSVGSTRRRVLRVIRADGPISRAELARSTGLSKPTINGVVELLLESGYLKERVADVDSQTRRPGPRSRLLSFRGDLGHLLGIDIGADKVLVVVADLTGDVLGMVRRRTRAGDRRTAETLLDLVRAATDEALATAEVDRSSLQSVGVGTPGVVDPVSGRSTLAPQLRGWRESG